MSASIVAIKADNLELGLAPELGGSVAYLRLRQRSESFDLLRPLTEVDHAAGNILGVAMFPMVPYANCIEENVFDFDGRRYYVEPNLPPYKFNFHGRGWRSIWTVSAVQADRATLTFLDDSPDQPHRYSAVQEFILESNRLVVATTVANKGPRRMPFGFGQHPWFPRRDETFVKFEARQFWIESVDSSATEAIAIPPELDFSAARRPPLVRRNNCYAQWSGSVEVTWPKDGVGLRMVGTPIFRHLMVYFPAWPSSVFCLEPQTNLVSALTRMDAAGGPQEAGLIVLEPGQSASGQIVFTPLRV
jgi:aldose 1-epimerase